jgi:flagellar hook-length control protein FliK
MALKGVSPSPAASTPAAAGASGSSAASALLSAAVAAPATHGGPAEQTSGGVPFNFLQMLTQSTTAANSTTAPVKAADPKAPAKTPDDPDASAAQDPSASALAFILQSMAAAQAPAQIQSAPVSGAPQTNTATRAISATHAPSASGEPDALDAATAEPKNATAGASMQNLLSLLAQDSDADLETAPQKPQPTDDSDPTAAPTPADDNSTTTNAATAGAQMSAGSHFAVQHGADAPNIEVKAPVGSSAWADELGGKITWMAHQGIESASLQLSPEHLGPVEVRISVQDGGTSVWFGAAQADTRSALEQALPRLREMFATQGMTLTDAGVSREAPKQAPKQPAVTAVAGISAIAAVSPDDAPIASLLHVRLGLLDTYA